MIKRSKKMTENESAIEQYLEQKIIETELTIKALSKLEKPNRQTKQTMFNLIVKKDIYNELLVELKS